MAIKIILTTIGVLLLLKSLWVITNQKIVSRLMHIYANSPKKVRNLAIAMLILSIVLIILAQLFS